MTRFIAICNGMIRGHRKEALRWSVQALGCDVTSGSSLFWSSSSLLSASLCMSLDSLPIRRKGTATNRSSLILRRRREPRFPVRVQLNEYSSEATTSIGHRPRHSSSSSSSGSNVLVGSADTSTNHHKQKLNEFSRIIDSADYHNYQRCWELWVDLVTNNDNLWAKKGALKQRRNLYMYLSKSGVDKDKCYRLVENARFYVPDGRLRPYDYTNLINILVLKQDIQGIMHALNECLEKTSVSSTLQVLSWTLPRINKSHIAGNKLRLQFKVFSTIIRRIHHTPRNLLLDPQKYELERGILLKLLVTAQQASGVITVLQEITIEERAFGDLLMTACLGVMARSHMKFRPDLEDMIWALKKEYNLATPRDLQTLMQRHIYRDEAEKALQLYEVNKEYHSDSHFDVLLLCYAKLERWSEMQNLFESLFGQGDLPNLDHYKIVMDALSKIARRDIVDTLFEQFLARSFRPTPGIINALMYSRLAFGDTKGVESAYLKFEEFGISPDNQSSVILLLAYRDNKDLDSAMRVSRNLEQTSSMTIETFTTLISLCTERRDPVTAEEVFKLLKRHNIRPNLVFYNAYIACLGASHHYQKAFDTYLKVLDMGFKPDIITITSVLSCAVRMKRERITKRLLDDLFKFQIAPDSRWYSVMLDYFCDKGQFEQAERVFDEMKASGVPIDCYHYTVLMDGYVAARNFTRVVSLYKEMISKKVDPTFKAHATYLRAKTHLDPEDHKGEEMLEDFLQSETILDLTSNKLSRDKVPPRLIKPLIESSLRKKQFDRAKEILRFYSTAERGFGYDDIQVLLLAIEVYRRCNDWNMVANLWDKLVQALPDTFVRSSKDKNKRIIPGRAQHAITRAVNAKLLQLRESGTVNEVLPLIRNLEYHGIDMTNSNLNYIVYALVADDRYVLKAFEMTEKYLMKGYTFRIWKAKTGIKGRDLEPRRQLNVKTIRKLTEVYRRAVLLMSRNYDVPESEAFDKLRMKYPRLILALEKRIERGRQIRLTRKSRYQD